MQGLHMFKQFAIAIWLAASAGAATAGVEVIDVTPAQAAVAPAAAQAASGNVQIVVPAEYAVSSELPEPEVFLMMLVGLLLIGVRAGHISHEKFDQ